MPAKQYMYVLEANLLILQKMIYEIIIEQKQVGITVAVQVVEKLLLLMTLMILCIEQWVQEAALHI